MLLKNPTLQNLLDEVLKQDLQREETFTIFIGEHAAVDVALLQKELNVLNISFIGGVFPSVIYGNEKYDDGVIIEKWSSILRPFLIRGLESSDFELPNFDEIKYKNPYTQKKLTCMILVDGLTGNIATLLTKIYNEFSNNVNYIGGGAGSLTLQQKPCVFTNEGLFQDAALVMFVDMECQLGVKHGWESIHGPIVATKTDKNVIEQLNWQNAFDVYKSVVQGDSGKTFNDDNFFDIAKGYPFGIYKEGSENIVRDPITVNEAGHLVCVGEVPENTVLYILKGKDDSLIQSAEEAVKMSAGQNGKDIEKTFVVDCISRVLFLEDKFTEELKAIGKHIDINEEKNTPQGILTLGEISSSGEGFLEFYNKTIVIGTFTS